MEKLLSENHARALAGAGFDIAHTPHHTRLVRGRCEIQVAPSSGLLPGEERKMTMAIPVVRLGAERPLSRALVSYLEDRNRSLPGPGRFLVREDMVYHVCCVDADLGAGEIVEIALLLQETVERYGPKILNVLAQ